MHAGDWIAGYAAVVATAAFAWQFLAYWRARLPNLVLRIEPAIIIVNEDGPESLIALYDGQTVDPVGIEWYFDFRITNHGRTRVHVTSIHIAQDASFGRLGWDAAKRANLPLWLEPGEERSFRFTDDDLDGAVLDEVLDIRVSVSIGKEFTASSKILDPNGVVISSAKMFEGIIAKAGWTDQIFASRFMNWAKAMLWPTMVGQLAVQRDDQLLTGKLSTGNGRAAADPGLAR